MGHDNHFIIKGIDAQYKAKWGIPRNVIKSLCVSHAASILVTWPHLAGPCTMEFSVLHISSTRGAAIETVYTYVM